MVGGGFCSTFQMHLQVVCPTTGTMAATSSKPSKPTPIDALQLRVSEIQQLQVERNVAAMPRCEKTLNNIKKHENPRNVVHLGAFKLCQRHED